MSLYWAVYKCPLCGKLCTMGEPTNVPLNKLPELLAQVIKSQRFAMNPYLNVPPMQIPHKCADGSVGLAQFSGFQIKKEIGI